MKETKKTFSLELDILGNIENFEKAINKAKKSYEQLNLTGQKSGRIESTYDSIQERIAKLKKILSSDTLTNENRKAVEKEINSLNNLSKSYSNMINKLSEKEKTTKKNADSISKLSKAEQKYFSILDKSSNNLTELKKQFNDLINKKKQYGNIDISEKKTFAESEEKKLRQIYGGKEYKTAIRKKRENPTNLDEKTRTYLEGIAQRQNALSALKKEIKNYPEGLDEAIQNLEAQINEITNKSFNNALDFLKENKDALESSGIDINTIKNYEDLDKVLQKLKSSDTKEASKILSDLDKYLKEASETSDDFRNKVLSAGDSIDELTRRQEDIRMLKDQLLSFFSISNSIELFKRAIRSAYDTVTELDATMTEAAVVTDFSVSDMWAQLPTYTQEAKKLGATINDLYGATTLYYQQGLKTNEAMALGTETIKMARIAAMDSQEATQLMTAALRGFNMELNELSAQRVNDVYSELAAITAADTAQIGTAMSKTASIAASANMEFETTAALLAQIIETTQEAPETAGTALKTIIARFTEVKELFSEGQLIGSDEEGEEININKIDAALKTVGISLNDFLLGTKGLDDILLELASKWDTLDISTQRYIATTAAGSRQQSRFLAMMSDYDRTMELVNAANNSAGASQEQFEKTLDSLESKLNQLQDAWDQFSMGLTNSIIIKSAIDILTTLLDVVNKLTDLVSGDSQVVKFFTELTMAIAGLRGGAAILNSIFGSKMQNTGIGQVTSDLANFKILDLFGSGNTSLKSILENNISSGIKNGFNQGKKSAKDFVKILSDTTKTKSLFKISDFDDSLKGKINKKIFDDFYEKSGIILEEGVEDTLSNRVEAANKKILEQNEALSSLDKRLKAISISSAMAGAGLLALSNVFKDADGNATGISESISTIGTALMLLPVAIQVVEVAWKNFNATIPQLLIITVALTAIIALFKKVSDSIKKAEKEQERLNKAVENAKTAVEEATSKYNELSDSLDEINNLSNDLNTITKGTQSWSDSLAEVNNKVLELLNNFPQLRQYLDIGENGELIITDQQAILDAQRNQIVANQVSYVAAESERINSEYGENNNIRKDIGEILSVKFDKEILKYSDTIGLDSSLNGIVDEILKNEDKVNSEKILIDYLNKYNKNDIFSEEEISSLSNEIMSLRDTYYDNISYIDKLNESVIAATVTLNKDLDENNSGYAADFAYGILEKNSDLLTQFGYKDYNKVNNSELESALAVYAREAYGGTFNKEDYTITTAQGETVSLGGRENAIDILNRQQLSNDQDLNNKISSLVDQLNTLISSEGITDESLINSIISQVLNSGQYDYNNNGAVGNINYQGIDLAQLPVATLQAILAQATKEGNNSLGSAASSAIDSKKQTNIKETKEYSLSSVANQAVESATSRAEMSSEAFDFLRKQILNTNTALQDYDDLLSLVAAKNVSTTSALDSLNEVLSNQEDLLSMDKTTDDYANAINDIRTSISGMFDVPIDNNFVDKNLELIIKAASGSEEAIIELQRTAAIYAIETSGQFSKEMVSMLNNVNGYILEAGTQMEGTWVNTLNKMLEDGSIALEDLNNLVSGFGFQMVQSTDENGNSTFKAVALGRPSVPFNYTPPTLSSDSGSSGAEEEPYENSFDKYYNKVEDLNEELRIRNKLEEEYSNLIKNNSNNVAEVVNNLQEQIASLERQKELQDYLVNARRQQIKDVMDEYSHLSAYAWYNFNDNTAEINWDKINSVTDADLGSEIEEFVSKIEELQDQQDEAIDALYDIDNSLEELYELGKDEYLDIEQRVFDAIVQLRQDEIDNLSELNDTLNNANTEILDGIQDGINEIRTNRQLEEDRENIAEMERRLALLRTDTSGANDLEILKLQEQLDDARQSYTDSLIDKSIDEMTKQNQAAYEQRLAQIDLMTEQLAWDKESGTIAQQTNELMAQYMREGPDALYALLKDSEVWKGMAAGSKEDWLETLSEAYTAGMANWINNNLVSNDLKGKTITFIDNTGTKRTGTVTGKGQVVSNGQTFNGVYQAPDGSYAMQMNGTVTGKPISKPSTGSGGSGTGNSSNSGSSGNYINSTSVKKLQQSLNVSENAGLSVDGVYGSATKTAVKQLQTKMGLAADGLYGEKTYKAYHARLMTLSNDAYVRYKNIKGNPALQAMQKEKWEEIKYYYDNPPVPIYKTGGLADFTGPAWLDGTKSSPEYVLNASQTEGWLKLVDVLSNFKNLKDSSLNGNNYYQIYIDIEEMKDDYDVEDMMNKMKRMIEQDAAYRNVNAVNMGWR